MNSTTAADIYTHHDVIHAHEALLQAIEGTTHPDVRTALDCARDALRTDPTIALDHDRMRRVDLIAELARQLQVITKQAILAREHARILADATLTDADQATALARLGRINPDAIAEEERLLGRIVREAHLLATTARADWQDPAHLAEVARRLLPPQRVVTEIADRIRCAVRAAALVAPDDPTVRHLLGLADAIEQPTT